jgi:hypothetical protein
MSLIPGSNPGVRPSGQIGTNPGSRPSSTFGTNPGYSSGAAAMAERAPMVQPKSSALIYVLVGVLLVAIGVLAFLLFSGK